MDAADRYRLMADEAQEMLSILTEERARFMDSALKIFDAKSKREARIVTELAAVERQHAKVTADMHAIRDALEAERRTPASRVGRVVADVVDERRRQDEKWGGPSHDDSHRPEDWVAFIEQRTSEIDDLIGGSVDDADHQYRNLLIEIAALAVAAAESYDRTSRG